VNGSSDNSFDIFNRELCGIILISSFHLCSA
jgi:hypothetical protein